MSFQQVIDQIKHFAGLAVHFDRQGNIDAATYYYMETSFLIDSAPDQEELKIFRGKAAEYKKRAEELLLASKKANESSIGGKVSFYLIVYGPHSIFTTSSYERIICLSIVNHLIMDLGKSSK